MVISIEADILEVIMFTPCADAFLSVRGPVEWSFLIAQEIGNELIHTCIGKKQVGRLRKQGCRLDHLMFFGLEKVEKGLSDFLSLHQKILFELFKIINNCIAHLISSHGVSSHGNISSA